MFNVSNKDNLHLRPSTSRNKYNTLENRYNTLEDDYHILRDELYSLSIKNKKYKNYVEVNEQIFNNMIYLFSLVILYFIVVSFI